MHSPSPLRPAALLLLLCTSVSSAFTLRVDVNSAADTQSGWSAISATDTALGDSWSQNYPGGIGVDIDSIGGLSLDQRDRATNGGGTESNMWRDFVFAVNSFSTAPGTGMSIAITGLQPNTQYPVSLWAFDDASNGNRAADWSGGGAAAQRLPFPDSPTPSSLTDYTVTLNVVTNGSGAVTLNGIVSTTTPNASHNVFLNGFEIGDPVFLNGPTDISMSATKVARIVTIGSTVANLSTTDPTVGDTFTYSLVSGAGSANNGDFEISDNQLITERSLAANPGGTFLQVRIRSTDALGDSFEKAFLIEVINDSDNDGLDDDWEEFYFTDLTTATGSGNNDTDGLINTEEQTHGTHPLFADTDSDGINDDIEINLYNSNPLVKDTDGDGIDDGDEISSANGYVTDPTKSDTDGDGFSDAIEIAEQTSPIDEFDFPNTLLPLRINEILTSNDVGISDGFGKREDWIEIRNPNNQIVNLNGYYLTDDSSNLIKWQFPAISIPASGYLVVFASGNDVVDPSGKAHTNFNLSTSGEYLAIVRPNGTVIDDAISPVFPEQFTDISYGLDTGGNVYVFYGTPTPGAVNNTAPYPGVVKDTNFSIKRGFYNTPQSVAITSATPGAVIRYTTDGSKPSATAGTIYSGPVSITTTTNLRAIATFSNWLPTNVDTHTYIFVNDVVQQPNNPPGWASDWGFDAQVGAIVTADYGMDARVVNNTNGLGVYTVQEALLDIPSVSLSLPQAGVTGGSTGIYTNPRGTNFENECSIEYILPDGGTGKSGFQEDCKVEPHGNSSRTPKRMQKHSLRLTFSSAIGKPKLRYPLFPESKVEEFNKLVLRACFTDSWALNTWDANRYRPNDSMYMRDVWMKESMAAMGNESGLGNFVHLYVNGLYWGVHNLTERLEDDWYANHLGGKTEDWEVNADILTPGPSWSNMISVVSAATATTGYQNAAAVLDMDNYCDYIFLHFYADAEDWPTKNGYAAVNAISGDGKWRFQVWDQEISLDSFSWNRYSTAVGSMLPFSKLKVNRDFLMKFADRAAKAVYNGGALSQENAVDRFNAVAMRIDKAIVAESARWGDVQATTPYGNTAGTSTDPFAVYYPPTVNSPIYFTREQHWLTELNHVTNTHIPIILDDNDSRGIIKELRANNLYPSIDPPVFTQHGGFIPGSFQLGVTASNPVYYTTNGEDPRLPGGSINPNASLLTGSTQTIIGASPVSPVSLFALVPTDGTLGLTWTDAAFTKTGWQTAAPNSIGVGYERTEPGDYGPIIDHNLRSTMMDQNGNVYLRYEFNVTDAAGIDSLLLQMKYDDGYIAYLNGVQVDANNATTPPLWNSKTGGSHESLITSFDTSIAISPTLLQNGLNVLAIHGQNDSPGSSDFVIVPQLTSTSFPSVPLTGSQTVKARALTGGGVWSALTEAFFIANDLVVSEVMYRPATNGDAEYIEIMNIGSQTINLEGVEFTKGLTFAFAAGQSIAPGQRLLIVQNAAIFETVYGPGHPVVGTFIGGLSNDGETIQLEAAGHIIRSFTYNDVAPWPQAADGLGRSLVLIAPESNPDHSLPQNWRHSATAGGNPGTGDALPFTGSTPEDLSAYAFGTSQNAITRTGTGSSNFLVQRLIGADSAEISVEISNDLITWTNLGASLPVTANTVSNMTETLTYQISDTLSPQTDRVFLRASATLRP